MNGNVNAKADASQNANGDTLELSQLIHALKIIHDSHATNDARQNATRFLEEAKAHPSAPDRGFTLAIDKNQDPVLRHYGLSLLEHPIRYRWEELDERESATLRNWIFQLAKESGETEPSFLRNKVAHIWVELAKRCWIDEWLEMDSLLVQLWQQSFAQKDIVLHVLETLSDEVFSKDESLIRLQGGELGKACVEIYTPTEILSQAFPSRQPIPGVRHGDEGWLQRLSSLLNSCLQSESLQEKQVISCAVKILVVLRSAVLWVIPKAIHSTGYIGLFCRCLDVPDLTLHMACVETMHALYHRPNLEDEDIRDLVRPMLATDQLHMLHRLYQSCLIDVENIDDSKYTILKKLSETLCAIGSFVEQKPQLIVDGQEIINFLDLLLIVLQNPSLVVSIPILYIWTKLLGSRHIGKSSIISGFMQSLLELCSQRLQRYETLPDDSTDITYLFLLEDIETVPERHAFIANYRRYCMAVVELVVRKSPFDALRHILTEANNLIQSVYDIHTPFSVESFITNSPAILRTEAQLTVVMTALKGYLKWIKFHGIRTPEDNAQHSSMQEALEQWGINLLRVDYKDPIIRKRVLQLCVEVSTSALESKPAFAILVAKSILSMKIHDNTTSVQYHDAVKDLRSTSVKELLRGAIKFSSDFYPLYEEFEKIVNDLALSEETDTRTKLDHQSFLFTIIHRASSDLVSDHNRILRLERMLLGPLQLWQDRDLDKSLASLSGFMELLGLDKLPEYMSTRNAHTLNDWSATTLDQEGLELQQKVTECSDRLPLQTIKVFLGVSTDRLRRDSKDLQVAQCIWQKPISVILPSLLRFVSYAHSFQNPIEWTGLPPEMRSIVDRTLMDRVWQAGISTESREDFYARVRGSKSSLEGLASSVRSAIRQVRETSYWILHCMSQLGETFYGHQDLPEPLSQSLFANAQYLSAHQLTGLLKLAQALIEGCPPSSRHHFLPPMLTNLFIQLDAKITLDWKVIDQRKLENTGDASLDQEMKAESILRQLSHTAIQLIQSLLTKERRNSNPQDENDLSTRFLILSSPPLLESLVLFCTHALRMHDSRCCGIVTRILRSLAPEFLDDSPTAAQVREFFSTEVLKACITSLHEPYFSDLQKDLAALIAAILMYSTKTDTARQVLLSLPGMSHDKVANHLHYICKPGSEREHRSYVLSLLESVRGVSIAEQGKIDRVDGKKHRTAMQKKFMGIDEASGDKREGSVDLGGIADLFG